MVPIQPGLVKQDVQGSHPGTVLSVQIVMTFVIVLIFCDRSSYQTCEAPSFINSWSDCFMCFWLGLDFAILTAFSSPSLAQGALSGDADESWLSCLQDRLPGQHAHLFNIKLYVI